VGNLRRRDAQRIGATSRRGQPGTQSGRRAGGPGPRHARVARSELLPSLSLAPTFTRERFAPSQTPDFADVTANTFGTTLDLSYEIDLWGRVRRGFESARAEAAASVAAYHNVLLTLQGDVAQTYFLLRSLDAEIASVTSTVRLRQEQVQLVRSRFEGGIGNELDVARAETELATTEAEAASLAKRRAELENALAILIGVNPAAFQLAALARPTRTGIRSRPPFPPACPQTCSNAVRTLPKPSANSPPPTPASASPKPLSFRSCA